MISYKTLSASSSFKINTDGFKILEISEDILKTLKSIENAQKNETPLTIRNSSTDGFKRNEYAFEERIGDISDEEAMDF